MFKLQPTVALTLLARSIEALVSFTGDVPPTPPLSHPSSPALSASEPDEEIQDPASVEDESVQLSSDGYAFQSEDSSDIDGVRTKKRSNYFEPVPAPKEEGKFIAAGVDNALQYSAITRKFWSKSVPEIPIEDYIFRCVLINPHCFCKQFLI